MPAVISKKFILDEIRRTAAENKGQPFGSRRFESETAIRNTDWCGIYWARWSDALCDAGFAPNERKCAYDKNELLRHYASFAKEIGRLPVKNELLLRRRADRTFPHAATFHRFGTKKELLHAVALFCKSRPGYSDVLLWCEDYLKKMQGNQGNQRDAKAATDFIGGHVYLVKSGHFYKIGKTNAVGRREYELALQLPERAKTIHVMSTDDPIGIEAYWHKRFEAKRKNGEWLDLDNADVAAFKRRRKFM